MNGPFAGAMPNAFAPLSPTEVAAKPQRGEPDIWEPTSPAPTEPTLPRRAVSLWTYRDAQGRPLCARVRFDREDGGKDVLPYAYGRRVWTDRHDVRQDVVGWHHKEPAKPLPLYGLDRLAERPEAPVLLVEGEKTADAAAELFPDHVVITSQGGSKAPGRSDWSPIARRVVTIWPDADDAGVGYADATVPLLREAGVAFLRRVVPSPELPKGWDLADELPLMLSGGDDRAALRAMLEEAGPASSNVKMPDGFRMQPRGLFFYPEAKGEGEPPPRVFVAAPFDIIAETNDGGGLGWGLLLRWLDRDGRMHEWAVPRRLLLCDEIDKYPPIREGDPISLAEERTASFGVNWLSLRACSPTPADVAERWLAAKDDEDRKLSWWNTQMGRPYRPNVGKEMNVDGLAARGEVWPAEVPDGVVLITVGADFQGYRGEFEVVGWGRDEESWSIAHHVIEGDPASIEFWGQADAFLKRVWHRADGRGFEVMAACLDSGHHTQQVYQFAKDRLGRRIWAVKGASERSGQRSPIWPTKRPSSKQKQTFRPIILGVNAAKDVVRSRLQLTAPGPQYMHFPADREVGYFAQLTAERLVTKMVGGHKTRVWELPPGRANEALDCRVYAYAALCGLVHLGLTVCRVGVPSMR